MSVELKFYREPRFIISRGGFAVKAESCASVGYRVRGLEFEVLRTVNGELGAANRYSLHLREAAIHEQLRSRDVAAVVGGKKHYRFRDLSDEDVSAFLHKLLRCR